MYYDLGSDFLEHRTHGFGGRDVGVVVGGAGEAVVRRPEVEDGDVRGCGFQELEDDVAAEEAAAADYEDGAGVLGGSEAGHGDQWLRGVGEGVGVRIGRGKGLAVGLSEMRGERT